MALYLYGGKLLNRPGGLAVGEACCCGTSPCFCPDLCSYHVVYTNPDDGITYDTESYLCGGSPSEAPIWDSITTPHDFLSNPPCTQSFFCGRYAGYYRIASAEDLPAPYSCMCVRSFPIPGTEYWNDVYIDRAIQLGRMMPCSHILAGTGAVDYVQISGNCTDPALGFGDESSSLYRTVYCTLSCGGVGNTWTATASWDVTYSDYTQDPDCHYYKYRSLTVDLDIGTCALAPDKTCCPTSTNSTTIRYKHLPSPLSITVDLAGGVTIGGVNYSWDAATAVDSVSCPSVPDCLEEPLEFQIVQSTTCCGHYCSEEDQSYCCPE